MARLGTRAAGEWQRPANLRHPDTVDQLELTTSSAGLTVAFPSGTERLFTWHWLRDHDQSPAAFDATTKQRRVDTFEICEHLQPVDVSMRPGVVVITWGDGSPATEIDEGLLAKVAGTTDIGDDRIRWDASAPDPRTTVTFTFERLVAEGSDSDVAVWLANIRRHGFALVTGIPDDLAETERLVRRIAPPQETIFGRMWTVESGSVDHADSAYSSESLEPHTDGTYVHDAPGLQLLHFVQQAGEGGASILVDGLTVVDQLLRDDPAAVEVLRTTTVPAHYLEPGVELRAARPALRFDEPPMGDSPSLLQISFNNYDRSPMWLEPAAMTRFYAAYSALHDRIVDPANQLQIVLQPGEAVVFDNWRVLHGRTGFTGQRTFNGAYVARDLADSRRRVLASQVAAS